jgi:hypothetical protein
MKLVLTAGALALSAASLAQYSSDFESPTYTGSASGNVISGQAGWYNPVAGSVDGNVHTYAGNTLGFASNPTGGSQFLGGAAGANPMRAQHDFAFGSGAYTLTFDFNGNFIGTPPSADNLGSVSLQPSATANIFQTIYQWGTNTATPTQFNANMGFASAAGGAITVFTSPGTAWTNLAVNHWYRQSVTWDFTSNRILQTTIQDLTAGGSLNSVSPTDWYLSGGAANVLGLAAPTAFRFFAAGSVGNVMGYDNVTLAPVPEPCSMVALSFGALALLRKRRKA